MRMEHLVSFVSKWMWSLINDVNNYNFYYVIMKEQEDSHSSKEAIQHRRKGTHKEEVIQEDFLKEAIHLQEDKPSLEEDSHHHHHKEDTLEDIHLQAEVLGFLQLLDLECQQTPNTTNLMKTLLDLNSVTKKFG